MALVHSAEPYHGPFHRIVIVGCMHCIPSHGPSLFCVLNIYMDSVTLESALVRYHPGRVTTVESQKSSSGVQVLSAAHRGLIKTADRACVWRTARTFKLQGALNLIFFPNVVICRWPGEA